MWAGTQFKKIRTSRCFSWWPHTHRCWQYHHSHGPPLAPLQLPQRLTRLRYTAHMRAGEAPAWCHWQSWMRCHWLWERFHRSTGSPVWRLYPTIAPAPRKEPTKLSITNPWSMQAIYIARLVCHLQLFTFCCTRGRIKNTDAIKFQVWS